MPTPKMHLHLLTIFSFLSYVRFILWKKKNPYATQMNNCCVPAIDWPRPKNSVTLVVTILDKTITSRYSVDSSSAKDYSSYSLLTI